VSRALKVEADAEQLISHPVRQTHLLLDVFGSICLSLFCGPLADPFTSSILGYSQHSFLF
jgi:hypothetical protein